MRRVTAPFVSTTKPMLSPGVRGGGRVRRSPADRPSPPGASDGQRRHGDRRAAASRSAACSVTDHVPAPPPASVICRSVPRDAAPPVMSSSPSESDAGSVKTCGLSARATLISPAPSSVTGASCVRSVLPHAGPAVDISADLTCCVDHVGCRWTSSAAAPATCGAAMLVPSKTANGEPANSRQRGGEDLPARRGDVRLQQMAERRRARAEEKLVTIPLRPVSMSSSPARCESGCGPVDAHRGARARRRRRRRSCRPGSAAEAGCGFASPERLSTSTIPIAPACCARPAFDANEHEPRDTSAIAPVSEFAGSGLSEPFGSAALPQRWRSTGWPLRPTIVPTSTSCWFEFAHASGVVAARAGSAGAGSPCRPS